MIYIKPKLKVKDKFFIIEDDKVKEMIVESILINSKSQNEFVILYLSNNISYTEDDKNFFLTKEEAKDLIDNGLKIQFKEGDLVRYATPSGIEQVSLVRSYSYFNETGLYNQTHHVKSNDNEILNINNTLYQDDDYDGVAQEFLKLRVLFVFYL